MEPAYLPSMVKRERAYFPKHDTQRGMAAANVVYWVTPQETVAAQEKNAIDWDCPCLDSIRKSPCFPTFRASIECMDKDPDNGDSGNCQAEIEALDDCLRDHPPPEPLNKFK